MPKKNKTYSPARSTLTNAYWFIREPIKKVTAEYNPDHDMGPGCAVTWREHRLATALDLLVDQVFSLETRIEELESKTKS